MKKYIIVIFVLTYLITGCVNNNHKLGYEVDDSESELATSLVKTSKAIAVSNNRLPQSSLLSKTYSDKNISIKYPSSWEVVRQNVQATNNTTIDVLIMQKSINNSDFCPNVSVVLSNRKHKESTSYIAEQGYNTIKKAGLDASLIGIRDCQVSGYSGSVVEYIMLYENYRIYIYQYIVKKKNNAIVTITIAIDSKNLNSQKKVAQEIIESVVIF